ncbi:hypothetical protein AA11237_0128 [Acidocella aminolytica 101 = DSM 11237]|nr:hypothetical protein AA11237_0128 [Acidocella aminolytica 101 = DSM 11237]
MCFCEKQLCKLFALGQKGNVLTWMQERAETCFQHGFPPPKAQPAPGTAQAKGLQFITRALWKAGGSPCRTDGVKGLKKPESLRSQDRGGSALPAVTAG